MAPALNTPIVFVATSAASAGYDVWRRNQPQFDTAALANATPLLFTTYGALTTNTIPLGRSQIVTDNGPFVAGAPCDVAHSLVGPSPGGKVPVGCRYYRNGQQHADGYLLDQTFNTDLGLYNLTSALVVPNVGTTTVTPILNPVIADGFGNENREITRQKRAMRCSSVPAPVRSSAGGFLLIVVNFTATNPQYYQFSSKASRKVLYNATAPVRNTGRGRFALRERLHF